MTRGEWGACVVAGSTVLLVAALLKLTPKALLKAIPMTKFIDEDKEANDGMVNAITKYSNVQVNINMPKGKKKGAATDGADDMGDNDYKAYNEPA